MENESRLSWREPLAVLASVALTDAAIYHGAGYAGISVTIFGLLLLFFFGVFRHQNFRFSLLFAFLTIIAVIKLFWCGRPQIVCLGFIMLLLVGASLVRCPLELYNLLHYLFQSIGSGFRRIGKYIVEISKICRPIRMIELAAVLIPLCCVFVFSLFFIFANPNILAWIQNAWNRFLEWFPAPWDWLPGPLQIAFWGFVAVLMFGLLSPRLLKYPTSLIDILREFFVYVPRNDLLPTIDSKTDQQPKIRQFEYDLITQQMQPVVESPEAVVPESEPESQSSQNTGHEVSVFYGVCRNTLLALIVLFSVYLVFEFRMNWLRNFPENLDYSAYMHQGAMFLTAALALSTVVLCTIFQKGILADYRIKKLKCLAWTWSVLNILLAVSVYNRLGIYIELNGLSRLRIMGLLGSTAALLGLLLVVWKIARNKNFRWLLAGYSWALLSMVFLYLVAPFDSIIAHHNVRRVMKGELLPSIFLLHSHDSAEDTLYSLPLLDSSDPIIRDGSRAIISERWAKIQTRKNNLPEGAYAWTIFQYTEEKISMKLASKLSLLEPFLHDQVKRKEDIEQFRRYTNRWIN